MHFFSRVSSRTHQCYWRAGIVLAGTLLATLQAATLNVQTFGAKGNGSADDTAAIQRTINSSASGDTIVFPAGTYLTTTPIALQSYRSYQGSGGAQIHSASGSYALTTPWDSTNTISISGLTINGGSLMLQGSSAPAVNVQISNCTFENVTTSNGNWTTHYGVFISSGLYSSSITNNTFRNILQNGVALPQDQTAGGIQGYNLKNVTISGNTFDTVNEGIYLNFNGPDTYTGVVISNNTGTNVHRMGIEIQGAHTSALQVVGNYFSNFLSPFYNTFGLSIVVEGTGSIVENNTLIGLPAPVNNRYGLGIEVGGTAAMVASNNIEGDWVWGIALGHAPSVTVKNNYLCGSASAQQIGWETASYAGAVIQGNTVASVCASTNPPPAAPPAPTAPTSPVPSGASLWLDPAYNVSAANGKVSAWGDRSGHAITATQSSSAAQPTLVTVNNKPVIGFDGKASWLSLPFPINGLSGMSIFLVSANTVDSFAGGYGFNAAMLWGETAAWGSTFVGPFQSSINYRFGTTQANNSPIYTRSAKIASQYSLTEIEKNGQNEYLYVNGSLVFSQGGKLSAINGSGAQLFLGLGINGTFFAGDIAEILVYPQALSDSQRSQVEQYLMNKYGLH